MNKVINKFISLIKGYSYEVDSNISISDLVSITFNRCLYLLRGKFKKIGLSKCGSYFFVGKCVKLYHKKFIECGKGVNLGNYVEINALSKRKVILGNNVKIGSYGVIRCTGTFSKIGKGITIGNNTSFDDNCFFGASGGIVIGSNVIAGRDIKFHSENHNFDKIDELIRKQGVSNKGIKIGDNCWIGSNVIFLDGVNVESGCVIGAGSIINKNVPPNCVVAGNPAKIIKNRKI